MLYLQDLCYVSYFTEITNIYEAHQQTTTTSTQTSDSWCMPEFEVLHNLEVFFLLKILDRYVQLKTVKVQITQRRHNNTRNNNQIAYFIPIYFVCWMYCFYSSTTKHLKYLQTLRYII